MIDAHLEEDYNDRYERRLYMQSRRERAMNTIAEGLNVDSFICNLAMSIAFAYKNDLEDAVILVNSLFLSQSDMMAILEDEDAFWEAYNEERL